MVKVVECDLRQKGLLDLRRGVRLFKNVIERWINHVGIKFLQQRELTDEQEAFLEELTEFYINEINNIENNASFLAKAVLGPIRLPKKKVKQ